MKAIVVGFNPYREGLHMGNLRWLGTFPMKGGNFPREHPAAGVLCGFETNELGWSPPLEAFRARGYWASCFPEGDGVTWKPLSGQDDTQAMADVVACFPKWEVLTEEAFAPKFREWERKQADADRQRRRAFIESKVRAETGKCSSIVRFSVFCTLAIGHEGRHKHIVEPKPVQRCCPRCGEWLDAHAHTCGRSASA